jgi:hypothetical protein
VSPILKRRATYWWVEKNHGTFVSRAEDTLGRSWQGTDYHVWEAKNRAGGIPSILANVEQDHLFLVS